MNLVPQNLPEPESKPGRSRPSGPSKRILGMTQGQLVILGGLAAFALLGLAAIGWTVLNAGLPVGLLTVPTTLPTATPAPTETWIPTRTPRGPTPTDTEVSYDSLIPSGWKEWNTGVAKFFAPPQFALAGSGNSLMALTDQNPDANHFAARLALNRENKPGLDLATYVQNDIHLLPGFAQVSGLTVLEQKKMEIGPYETVRVKVQAQVQNVPVEAAMYVFKIGDDYWSLTLTGYYSEYYTWLPQLDKAARTFRLLH